jgi:hypothetical protein
MRHPIWILAFLLTPTLVQAHALGVQAKLKDGKLHVEVYYDDNSPAIKATIKVMKGKDEIKTGVTDADGHWSFEAPDAGKYEIHADAGAGHNAKTTLTIPGAVAGIDENKTSVIIGDSPTREEFTRTPWLEIAIGVGVIAMLCVAFLLASMMRKNVTE